MKKAKYERTELEITEFSDEDILTGSGDDEYEGENPFSSSIGLPLV